MHRGSVHIISPGYTKQKGNVRNGGPFEAPYFFPGVLRCRGLVPRIVEKGKRLARKSK